MPLREFRLHSLKPSSRRINTEPRSRRSRPSRPAEQQQPQRSGPVTRSSRLAPIEKQRGRTFPKEEPRQRCSSLGAGEKKRRTRKGEPLSLHGGVLAFPTKKVGLGEVVQVANQVTLHNPSNPPSGTEATEVHCTQVEKSRQEDPGERNNAAPNFPERVPQKTEVERLAETPHTPQCPTISCGRNDELPNCGTPPEEYVRLAHEIRLVKEELHEMQGWLDLFKLRERQRIQSNLQPLTYTLPETGEQWTRQETIDDLEHRVNALKQDLALLQEKERLLVSGQALERSELSCNTNLEPQAPSFPGYSILTDDEERDGEDYSDLDPDEDRVPTSDDETETSTVSTTTMSYGYRTLKVSAQHQGSLSNQLGQKVDLPSSMLPKEQQERDAEMFIQAKMGCDEKEERRCRDQSMAMDPPEWYSRPARLLRARKRKRATGDSSGVSRKKLIPSVSTEPPASFSSKTQRSLFHPPTSLKAAPVWSGNQSRQAPDAWPQSWDEHHLVFTPPKVLAGKQEVVSNQYTAVQVETSLSTQPRQKPSASSSMATNDAHMSQPLFGESNLAVRDELNNAVYKTDPKPLNHSRLGTEQINSMALHRSSPQTCRESHRSHTPQLIASTASDVHYSKSTTRPKHTATKPATLEFAGKKSKTISETTSNAIATGREIVANMLGRTPRIGDNNLFKDSIKKMQQACQYLKSRDRLVTMKTAHTDSLSEPVSRGRDAHKEGGEDVCTAGTTDDPGENPRRDSHEEEGGSPNGHSVERKSLDSFQVASPDQETHEEGGVHDTKQSEPGKDTHEEGGEPPADPQSPTSTHATVRSSSDSPRKAEPEDDPLEEAGDQSGIPRNQNSFMQSSHAPPNRDFHEEVGETPAPTTTSKKGSQRTTFSVDESMFRASRKSKMKVKYKIWTKLLGVAALKFGNPIESPGKGQRPVTRWKHRKLRKFWKFFMKEDDLKTPKFLNGHGNNRPPEYGEPPDGEPRKMKNVRMFPSDPAQPCNNTEDHALSQKPNVILQSSVPTETCGSRAERLTKKRHKTERCHMKRVDQSNANLQHVPRPACVIQGSGPIEKISMSVNSKSLICEMQTLPIAAENFLPPEDYVKKRQLDVDAETSYRSRRSSVDFIRPRHHACDALTRSRRNPRTTALVDPLDQHTLTMNDVTEERAAYPSPLRGEVLLLNKSCAPRRAESGGHEDYNFFITQTTRRR